MHQDVFIRCHSGRFEPHAKPGSLRLYETSAPGSLHRTVENATEGEWTFARTGGINGQGTELAREHKSKIHSRLVEQTSNQPKRKFPFHL